MKTIQQKFKPLLILLMFGFAFASCSSDDSVANQAPNSFNLIEVADGATNVDLQPQLSWEAATDPDGDSVTYQVYFDSQNPPQTSIANNLGVNTFSHDNELTPGTIYYWKVIAKDSNGNTTETSVASFTSRDMTTEEAIVGKWFYESIEGEPALSECEKESFLLFTEDLFVQIKIFSDNAAGTCEEQGSQTTAYEIVGSEQIVLTGNGTTETWEIQSLTETELVLDSFGTIITFIKE